MSPTFSMIVVFSLAGAAVGVALLNPIGSRTWRFVLSALLAGAAFALYRSGIQPGIETKGAVQETIAVVCCYLSMVLGMVAQYFYRQAESGAGKLTFKPMEFMMPIFASPIVFIPLLTITTDVSLSGAFTKSKLMIYFVAFQNGFFWKGLFEQLRDRAMADARIRD
jgi:hypothetical protein